MIPPARRIASRAKPSWTRLVLLSTVGLAIAAFTNGCTAVACNETLTCLDPPGQMPSGTNSALGPQDAGIDAANTLEGLAVDQPAPDAADGDATGDDAPTPDAVADVPASDASTPDVQTDPTDARDAQPIDAQPACPGANLMTDPANCGSCNHACGGTFACSAGVCAAGPSIQCGGGAPGCAAGTQECCLAANSTLSCVPTGQNACSGGVNVVCGDKADCPGQVCCIELTQNHGTLMSTGCFALCPNNTKRSSWLELCAVGAGTCATGTCRPLTNVTPSPPFSSGWFSACR